MNPLRPLLAASCLVLAASASAKPMSIHTKTAPQTYCGVGPQRAEVVAALVKAIDKNELMLIGAAGRGAARQLICEKLARASEASASVGAVPGRCPEVKVGANGLYGGSPEKPALLIHKDALQSEGVGLRPFELKGLEGGAYELRAPWAEGGPVTQTEFHAAFGKAVAKHSSQTPTVGGSCVTCNHDESEEETKTGGSAVTGGKNGGG